MTQSLRLLRDVSRKFRIFSGGAKKHKWHLLATEKSELAQNLPRDPAPTQVHGMKHRFGLRRLHTISNRYRLAVSLCSNVHCFSRLSQDSGPLESASKLNFLATMQHLAQGKWWAAIWPHSLTKVFSHLKKLFCAPFCAVRFCQFLNKYCTNRQQIY